MTRGTLQKDTLGGNLPGQIQCAAVFLGENSRNINFVREASQWAGQCTKRPVLTFDDEASNRLGVGDVDRHG